MKTVHQNTVVIIVEGGQIQKVFYPEDITVKIVDWDREPFCGKEIDYLWRMEVELRLGEYPDMHDECREEYHGLFKD